MRTPESTRSDSSGEETSRRGALRKRPWVVVLAALIAMVPVTAWAAHQFNDVPNDHTFHTEIGAVHDAGITGGFQDGGFHPADNITRQAVAAFDYRGLSKADINSTADGSDVPSSIGEDSPVTIVSLTGFNMPAVNLDPDATQLVEVEGMFEFDFFGSDTTDPFDDTCPCLFEVWLEAQSCPFGCSGPLFESNRYPFTILKWGNFGPDLINDSIGVNWLFELEVPRSSYTFRLRAEHLSSTGAGPEPTAYDVTNAHIIAQSSALPG